MGAVRPLARGGSGAGRSNGRSPCPIASCATCRSLRSAAVSLVAERGIQEVTSESIAWAAGISVACAAEHYPSLDHCLTAAYDEATTHFREVAARALDGDGPWHERLRAAAAATVEAFDAQPDLARYVVVEVWRSDLPMLREIRIVGRRRYVEMIAERRQGEVGEELPDIRMEMFVGAGHHVTSEELEQGDSDSLRDRLDQLIDVFEPSAPSPLW
jgi:AcrR family transcriptional regulator